jgi:NADH:ubiquinone oxidoreductase subunit E
MSVATSAIERLQHVAGRTGAVTRADERDTASELHVPLAAVHGAATFYDDLAKTRRGSRHVRVCEGTACFAADGGQHIAEVEQALGVSVGACCEDGSASLQAVRCIGYCYAAPALLDGTVPHAGPTLAEKLARGRPDAPPIPVTAISEPVVLAGIVAGEDPWQHWPQVLASWTPQRLIDELTASGLRGRGGAEFPVAAKWSAAAAGPVPRYVVGNGDEGDPGSFCDRVLMEQDPHRVLAGLAYAAHAVGAERGYVYVRSEYPAAVASLHAVAEATSAGSPRAQRTRHNKVLRSRGRRGCRFVRRGRGNRAAPRVGGTAGCGPPEAAVSDIVRAIRSTYGGQQCRDSGIRALDRRPWR